ncbi:MAG: hypothetical protein Q4B99_00030 [Clostridia bacterium]|nr:hypothetical protein [Clostridia bacterium]
MKRIVSVLSILLVLALAVGCASPVEVVETPSPDASSDQRNPDAVTTTKDPSSLTIEDDLIRSQYMQLMPKEQQRKFSASVLIGEYAERSEPEALIVRSVDEYQEFIAGVGTLRLLGEARKLSFTEEYFQSNVMIVCSVNYTSSSITPEIIGVVGTNDVFYVGVRTITPKGELSADMVSYHIIITLAAEEAASLETAEILMLDDIG